VTFLAPAAGIIAGAIALPVLLALYLLKLRRRPVRVSTILFWPVAQRDVQVNVPLRWIRPSALLALHLLILALLVLALARPVVEGADGLAQRTIILLDVSASMSARDMPGNATRLEAARERARDIVRSVRQRGGEAAIVAFGVEPRALSTFTASRATLDEAIAAARATDEAGDLSRAVALAEAMLLQESTEDEAAPAQGGIAGSVVIISDGSFAGDMPRLAASPLRARFERVGPEDAGFPDAALADVDNVGIIAISAQRAYEDPATLRVFAQLLNASARARTLSVTLSINGRAEERRAVTVPARTPAATGRVGVTFELQRRDGGVIVLTLSEGGVLASDDSAAVVVNDAPRTGVVLARRAASGQSPADFLLEDALREIVGNRLRLVNEDELRALAARGALGGDALLVLDRVAIPPAIAAPVLAFVDSPPGATETSRALVWVRDHPVLRDVSLDALLVLGVADLESGPADLALATSQRGPLIIAREATRLNSGELQPRQVIVGFALERSNWPLLPGFPIFLANAVDHLTLRSQASAGHSVKVGTLASITAAAPGVITLQGPEEENLRIEVTQVGVVPVGVLSRAGVYVAQGRAAADRAIAANVVDEVESTLASPAALEVSGEAAPAVRSGVRAMELWPWLVLAAGVLLLIEWFVYAWRTRPA
jgi:hypothetical protein